MNSSNNTAWEQWDNGAWYTYDHNDSWGLSVSHAIFPILCNTVTGKEHFLSEHKTMVYPNPTTGQLNIIVINNYKEFDIHILNILGEQIEHKRFEGVNNHISLDINHLPQGVYFLQLSSSLPKKHSLKAVFSYCVGVAWH